MDQRPLLKAKPASFLSGSAATPRITGLPLCLILLCASSSVAAGRNSARLMLAPHGAIGAWSLSGPCPNIEAFSARGDEAACNGVESKAFINASGDFDWGELLNVPPNTTAAARANADLHFDSAFEGWLLVGADGKMRVRVDGRLVYRRDRPLQRGHAFVPIAQSLGPGTHSLVIELERSTNRSSFSVLLRDKRTNQAPPYAELHTPVSLSSAVQRSSSCSIRLPPLSEPLELRVELSFPAAAVNKDLPISLELRSDTPDSIRRWHAGVLRAEEAFRGPHVIHLGPLRRLTSMHASRLTVELGEGVITRPLWLPPELVATLERAARALALPTVRESARSPNDALGATLQAHVERISASITDPNRRTLDDALRDLNALLQDLYLGNNPFTHSGYVNAFIRSRFDLKPTSVMAYVPGRRAVEPLQARPLVIALHGYDGSPRKILDAFLDIGNDGQPAREIDGVVIAPAAYGDAFYRGPGENAVIEALDWAINTYHVDPSRIYITGVSMGGTGAAEIALKHSERFAAAAPLCGYQSYFVRRDTSNRPLRPWEQPLMHRFSPASFAESGNDVPMFIAQGLKDTPLENSRVLTKRYSALGHSLVEDWPNLGHSVWKKSYRGAAMYSWLAQWKKDREPKQVVVASSSLRHGRKFWLEIEKMEPVAEPALLDGRIETPNLIELKTRGVAAFRVSRSRHIDDGNSILVVIDGQSIVVPAGNERRFERLDGAWQLKPATTSASPSVIPVEGPWSELFSEPVAVVYGTGNASTVALNREIASRLVEPRRGVDLRIPIVADRDFDPLSSELTRTVYVGTSTDHSILARIMDRLPLRNSELGIRLGAHAFAESDVGAAFVYPDPDRGDRLLGIVTANSPEGLWRVLALPALVPDFVVFDRGIDAAAGESVLGAHAFVRAAGFFRDGWSLPSDVSDPLRPIPR